MAPRLRIAAVAGALTLGAGGLAACGSEGISVPTSQPELHRGAVLFSEHCSGCHTLNAAGTEGSATKVRDHERTDGPNFNVRRETEQSVLYAIRNGGFSGAIMPQDVVTGGDAVAVAKFLSAYSGRLAKTPAAPSAIPNQGPSEGP